VFATIDMDDCRIAFKFTAAVSFILLMVNSRHIGDSRNDFKDYCTGEIFAAAC
jgi:hypothetical protein